MPAKEVHLLRTFFGVSDWQGAGKAQLQELLAAVQHLQLGLPR